MSVSRHEFLVRLETLAACLLEANVSDGAPTDYVRNQIAGLMRQGLAVLAFTALEAFVRGRTSEVLREFDPKLVRFSDLSDAIQEAATLGAARGLLFRSKFEDEGSRLAWALRQLKDVAASDTSLTTLSHLSFGSDKANLDEGDMPQILKAFGVDKPWPNVTAVAKSVGFGGVLDAKQQFIEIKQRRHSSAHEITSIIPHGDLLNSVQAIRGLAVGFDLLLSQAVAVHNLGRIPGKPPEPKIDHSHIKLLFVEDAPTSPGQFEVYRMMPATQSTPASRITLNTFPSEFEAVSYAVQEAQICREQTIAVGAGGLIEDWHPWQ